MAAYPFYQLSPVHGWENWRNPALSGGHFVRVRRPNRLPSRNARGKKEAGLIGTVCTHRVHEGAIHPGMPAHFVV